MADTNRSFLLRFASEGETPRTFRIAATGEGADVYDVDNSRFLARNMFSGKMLATLSLGLMVLENADWTAFRSFVSSRREFVPAEGCDVSEGRAVPRNGNIEAQIQHGIPMTGWRDLRTQWARDMDADELSGLRFRPMSREDIVLSLLAHDRWLNPRTGQSHLSWKAAMPKPETCDGRPADRNGNEIDRALDKEWAAFVKADPEVIEDCHFATIEQLCSRPGLEVAVRPDNRTIFLERAGGKDFGFASGRAFAARLEKLSDEELSQVWQEVASIDQTIVGAVRMPIFLEKVNEARARFELEYDEPESVVLT